MPSQSAYSQNYSMAPVLPKYDGLFAKVEQVNLAPSTTFVAGQLLGWITSSANDVQTLTITGSPSAGTFTLTGTNPLTGLNFTTAAIIYSATTTVLQTALNLPANFGPSAVTVTGSAGAWVVTFTGGGLAAVPVPLLALGTNAMSGGSGETLTPVHTTVGRTAGTYGKYGSSALAVPAAPSVSATGSGSGWGAGTHIVSVTAVNAQGETTVSIPTKITLTAAQLIRVAAQASLGTSATFLNIYVDGVLLAQSAVTSGTSAQADVDNVSLTLAGVAPPTTNTAYTIANGAGSQVAKCVNKYACQTDTAGNVSLSSTSTVGEWGQTEPSTAAYFSGIFSCADLTGLDAAAVTQLGRLWNGTTSAGELRVF